VALWLGIAAASSAAPALRGTVVDRNTGEPVPGALVKINYSGLIARPVEAQYITWAELFVATDGQGVFTAPARIIPAVPPLSVFHGIGIQVIHPLYASGGGYGGLRIVPEEMDPKRCKSIVIGMARLEDFLAEGESKVERVMDCGEYFRQAAKLKLPIDADKAFAYWLELAEKYPESKKATEGRIREIKRGLEDAHPPEPKGQK